MVQYNLKVENNIAERAIEKTLSQLKKNPSISLTKNGNVIRIKTISNGREIIRKSTPVKLHRKERRVATIKDDKDDNLMLSGPPITWNELRQQANEGWEDYKKGNYVTMDELKREMKSWKKSIK